MTRTLTRPHLGWVLGLTSTAFFMVVLDSVVVITALPRMQRDLHVGIASLQWTLTAYNIAFFAAGFLATEEFQLARGYSPVSAGVRLLPFLAMPMFVSPIAGAVSDRIGRRPVSQRVDLAEHSVAVVSTGFRRRGPPRAA